MEKADHDILWQKCLKMIRENISLPVFQTWFEPIQVVKIENKVLTLRLPSMAFYEYIEGHYVDLLYKTLLHEAGSGYKIMYDIPIDSNIPKDKGAIKLEGNVAQTISSSKVINSPENKFAKKNVTSRISNLDPQLNTKYRFDNFLEGKSNKLAYTAGKAIADNPGKTPFNPLYIYGASGVGKTHLMNAIGIQSKDYNASLRVLYVTAQLFKVQYTDAVRNNRVNDFINFYQSIDMLIVDDIQEFAGLEGTQNTFFHIFNHLQLKGKQLILSSDKPPVQLNGLEERLLTRFKWGLMAEVERPDYELNKAILHRKMQQDGLAFPDDVVEYIALNVKDNIRDLEGVIVSLMAHSIFQNQEITLELAKKELSKCVKLNEKEITVEEIQKCVCRKFEVENKMLLSKSRKQEVVRARQISMFFAKKYTAYSLSRIGEMLGKRDHSTVLHACKTVKNQMEYDKKFRGLVNELDAIISSLD